MNFNEKGRALRLLGMDQSLSFMILSHAHFIGDHCTRWGLVLDTLFENSFVNKCHSRYLGSVDESGGRVVMHGIINQ
jgi:metal-dependent hydrolase (beta-lactamase superfamily II)